VLDLNAVIAGLEKMLHRLISENISIVTSPGPGLGRIRADEGQVEQVILNLVLNARDAMPDGGTITIETADVDLDEGYVSSHFSVKPGPYAMLCVSDTGIGMDAETKSHLFEPFFTTKESGKGTGLGLSTVYGIVKQNEGNIWVYSEPGKGSTFKVYLPRNCGDVVPAARRQIPSEVATGTETILAIDDEEMIRNILKILLEEGGYTVLLAKDGEEADKICAAHAGEIHLLLTDVVLPKMNGREVARHLTARRPQLRVLYMSGYTANAIAHHGVLDSDVAFLPKPFEPTALLRKIREVLDAGKKDTGT
jgi:two-component system cell cycle sensor histidine kinase/response regulator CckA